MENLIWLLWIWHGVSQMPNENSYVHPPNKEFIYFNQNRQTPFVIISLNFINAKLLQNSFRESEPAFINGEKVKKYSKINTNIKSESARVKVNETVVKYLFFSKF